MDPSRVHSFLQAACAGLGFDIGEIWLYRKNDGHNEDSYESKNVNMDGFGHIDESYMSQRNGSSGLEASILLRKSNSGMEQQTVSTSSSTLTKKDRITHAFFRFMQLYTSRNYEAERSKLVCPHSSDDSIGDAGDVNEHVLSPLLVQTICNAMNSSDPTLLSNDSDAQVVWANSSSSSPNQANGLLGRSDMKLRTAIGMPFAVDKDGNTSVVVMFSPHNLTYTEDAMDHLKFIAMSVTSSNIPCIMPISDTTSPLPLTDTKETNLLQLDDWNLDIEKRRNSFSSLFETNSDAGIGDRETDLGNGVKAHLLSFVNKKNMSSSLSIASDFLLDSPKYSPSFSFISSSGNKKLRSGSLSMPTVDEPNNFFLDEEASYGVWSTIMNSDLIQSLTEPNTMNSTDSFCSSDLPIVSDNNLANANDESHVREPLSRKFSDVSAQAMEFVNKLDENNIFDSNSKVRSISEEEKRNRLEDFAQGFLGMSIFDLSDIWMPENCGFNKQVLKHKSSIIQDKTNEDFITFREFSRMVNIEKWSGAPGRAFASSQTIWSSTKEEIIDTSRAHAFHQAKIKSVLSVPVLSEGSKCVCVLNFYAQQQIERNTFVINFVEKAVKLVWRGLQNVEPHSSISCNTWNDINPFSIGEMAANEEIQTEFSKKRPIEDTISTVSQLQNGISSSHISKPVLTDSNTFNKSESERSYLSLSNYQTLLEVAKTHLQDASTSSKKDESQSQGLNSDSTALHSINWLESNKSARSSFTPTSSSKPSFPIQSQVAINTQIQSFYNFQGMNHKNYAPPAFHDFSKISETKQVNGDVGSTSIKPGHSQQPLPIFSSMVSMANMTVPPLPDRSVSSAYRVCRIEGCDIPVFGRKPYCAKHKGNRQCEHPSCKKCAQGTTRFCIAHGGGRRCTYPGCDKGARDKKFCAAHGGGKRCTIDGCHKGAVGGKFCTAHGGGKRCAFENCTKAAQASTKFCVKHGGGRKCTAPGCEKVARGKTKFCASHGGSVICRVEGCTRAAIRRSQLCRKHGQESNSAARFPICQFLPNT